MTHRTAFGIALGTAFVVAAGSAYVLYGTPLRTSSPTEPYACTMDALVCPDGSAVGRDGPACAFTPCPHLPSLTGVLGFAEGRFVLLVASALPEGAEFTVPLVFAVPDEATDHVGDTVTVEGTFTEGSTYRVETLAWESNQPGAQRAAVEEYLREHISELSPEPAVLGGTFYVTAVRFMSDTTATVEYEDGHIALVADVVFTVDASSTVSITSFTLWENGQDAVDTPSEDGGPICDDVCGNGTCEEVVCMGTGCPCPESENTCPIDCS